MMIIQKSNLRGVLTALLVNRKMSEAELSRRTGVSQPTLHRLVSGATPDTRVSTLKAIAAFFKISLGQLIGDEPLPFLSENSSSLKLIKIPLIPWDNAFEWKKIITNFVPTNWTYWTSIDYQISQNCYAIINNKGDLPMPFSQNSIIIVDPDAESKTGNYLVVYKLSNKSVTIKKLHLEGTEKWLLPLNKKINAETLSDDFLICGTILQSNIPLLKHEGE